MRERAGILRHWPLRAVHDARLGPLVRACAGGLLLAGAAGLFLAVSGAFGVAEAGLIRRAVYWIILLLAGAAMSHMVRLGLRRTGLPARSPVLCALVQTLVLAPLLTGLVAIATQAAFSGRVGYADPARYFLPVLAVTAGMTALRLLTHRRGAPVASSSNAAATPRLVARLPARLRQAELLALQAEDHYLRVHTSVGSTLLLMRLTDALAELEGVEGARTHRSWWVARSAVQAVRPQFGRAVLELPGGLEARVSRRYAAVLRRAGWY